MGGLGKNVFTQKKEGDLGIRNFDVFNRALLVKQAWRVMSMPDSLMSKVLKGKYFPSRNFLEAHVITQMRVLHGNLSSLLRMLF